jgi:hypothetical protein
VKAVHLTCQVLTGLRWQWFDHTLPEEDTEAYEEHLLFCPPCLVENDKARVALVALRDAAVPVPVESLVRRLAATTQQALGRQR